MCLDILLVKDLESQIGYKVFKKIDGKIYGSIYHHIDKPYKKKVWIKDENLKPIYSNDPISIGFSYPTGFHIYQDLKSAIEHVKSFCNKEHCIFKVKYRQVVAIGKQDPTCYQVKDNAKIVIIAKEMMLLEEIKI